MENDFESSSLFLIDNTVLWQNVPEIPQRQFKKCLESSS